LFLKTRAAFPRYSAMNQKKPVTQTGFLLRER